MDRDIASIKITHLKQKNEYLVIPNSREHVIRVENVSELETNGGEEEKSIFCSLFSLVLVICTLTYMIYSVYIFCSSLLVIGPSQATEYQLCLGTWKYLHKLNRTFVCSKF